MADDGTQDVTLLGSLPVRVDGASREEVALIRDAWTVWAKKYPRNQLRSRYFDGKVPVKLLGKELPSNIVQRLKPVLDWPAKACTALARRSQFEGFAHPDHGDDPYDLDALLWANDFEQELAQAILSAYKHSCAFLTVTRGDTRRGQPEVVVHARSAEWTAGLWNHDLRRVAGVLAIKDVDKLGIPTQYDMHLPGVILACRRRTGTQGWVAERIPTGILEVTAEPVVYDPQLGRPFGRSRISRAVMSTVNDAMRQLARMEIAAEHYAIPRIMVLGMAEEAFREGKWKLSWDTIAGLTRDEEGNLPHVEQLTQLTMQPLVEQFRQYASKFSAETGLPLNSLGIVQDNPASAEAMYAAQKDLIEEAVCANHTHTGMLRRLVGKIVALRDGAPPPDLHRLEVTWKNPAFASFAASADAVTKLAGVFPWFADSPVALEAAGFTRAEIARLLADKQRHQGVQRMEALTAALNAQPQPQPAVPAVTEDTGVQGDDT